MSLQVLNTSNSTLNQAPDAELQRLFLPICCFGYNPIPVSYLWFSFPLSVLPLFAVLLRCRHTTALQPRCNSAAIALQPRCNHHWL
jgi:hypothetical protein